MFESKRAMRPKIGVFALGLEAYWAEFSGLLDRLQRYEAYIEQQLASWGEIVTGGMVDSESRARAAGELFANEQVDVIFMYVATYAPPSHVLPVIQVAGAPGVVLNLQPSPALDYENATLEEWLANSSAAWVPEICSGLLRARYPFKVVSGMLCDDSDAWQELREWCLAAYACHYVKQARLGLLGPAYAHGRGPSTDYTVVQKQLGCHIEALAIDELNARVREAGARALRDKLHEIESSFDFVGSLAVEDIERSARVAVGMDRLIQDFNLDGLTCPCREHIDGEGEYRQMAGAMLVGNTLLTTQGIPCSAEGDLASIFAMLVMDRLGSGGSFSRFYAMDFVEQFVLMGSTSSINLTGTSQRPQLRKAPQYGHQDYNLVIEVKLRYGPVTILSAAQQSDSTIKFLVAEGQNIAGPTLRAGNAHNRVRFTLDAPSFMTCWSEAGATGNVTLGVGAAAELVSKVGYILGVETLHFV
jgi:L-arabinose isomerase